MRKVLYLGIAALAAAIVMSCGKKTERPDNDDLRDSTDIPQAVLPTVYGIVASTSSGDTLKLIIDNGDTLTINIAKAREEQRFMGKIIEGDRMILQTNEQMTIAESVINQNMLLGDWVMPDPIDGSSEIGISIKEGGIVEGIDQSAITYRTWKIVDGQIEIVSIRDGGGQEEETNYYNIVKLTEDSLTFSNDEDSYEYSRQKPHEGYGTDIKLEESSFDEDFVM